VEWGWHGTSGLYDDWGFDLKDVDGKGCHALARGRGRQHSLRDGGTGEQIIREMWVQGLRRGNTYKFAIQTDLDGIIKAVKGWQELISGIVTFVSTLGIIEVSGDLELH
jgi:hypothetical protein